MTKRKTIMLLIALVPVALLATSSYFNAKGSECYSALAEIRYEINNSYFELSLARQQFKDANESLSTISNPSNISEEVEYVKFLIQNVKDLMQNSTSTQDILLSPSLSEGDNDKKITELLFSAAKLSAAMVVDNSTKVRSLLSDELNFRKKCELNSNLATIFLYISLVISVIVPILKWIFWDYIE